MLCVVRACCVREACPVSVQCRHTVVLLLLLLFIVGMEVCGCYCCEVPTFACSPHKKNCHTTKVHPSPLSPLHHAAPRRTTQHYAAPRITTQHHAEPRSITQHHAAPPSITHHHAAQPHLFLKITTTTTTTTMM